MKMKASEFQEIVRKGDLLKLHKSYDDRPQIVTFLGYQNCIYKQGCHGRTERFKCEGKVAFEYEDGYRDRKCIRNVQSNTVFCTIIPSLPPELFEI
jgi:hypothetical protein